VYCSVSQSVAVYCSADSWRVTWVTLLALTHCYSVSQRTNPCVYAKNIMSADESCAHEKMVRMHVCIHVHACVYVRWAHVYIYLIKTYVKYVYICSHVPYRNTQQHTATHCNTLHRTITHCKTLKHNDTHLNEHPSRTQYNTLQPTASHSTALHTLHSTATQ